MTSDQRINLNVSNCPKCGTRLMCGRIIVTGYQQCPKCKRHWIIELEHNKVLITRASKYFEDLAASLA